MGCWLAESKVYTSWNRFLSARAPPGEYHSRKKLSKCKNEHPRQSLEKVVLGSFSPQISSPELLARRIESLHFLESFSLSESSIRWIFFEKKLSKCENEHPKLSWGAPFRFTFFLHRPFQSMGPRPFDPPCFTVQEKNAPIKFKYWDFSKSSKNWPQCNTEVIYFWHLN